MTRKLDDAGALADDTGLVEAFQSGSDPAGAIEALFDRYGEVTFAFFCRGIGDPRIAEELNQDLYIEVIKGLPRFRRQASFKTWLFRLAYNQLSNLRRRWRTHLDEKPVDVPEELWGQLAPEAPSAESALRQQEARIEVRRCLARLPEIERAIVLGRYYEGVTLEELTRQLQLTNPSGARASLIAAQRKLKKCLERSGVRSARTD